MKQPTRIALLATLLAAAPVWAQTPLPTITSISPTSGDCSTLLTITGTNFRKGAKVLWGGPAYASPATVRSATQLSVYLPAVVATTVVPVYVATMAGFSRESGGLVTINPAAAGDCGR
jgi:hypothetical protein